MKILFLTHTYPNYVPDLLLHGLRVLFGPAVVDYPRKDCLYDGVLGLGVCPDDQRCPDWFPADGHQVDRDDIAAKLNNGYFDIVVADCRVQPWQSPVLASGRTPLVIVEGEDQPLKIPPGRYVIARRETDGSGFSIPLPMGLPETLLNWIGRYDHLEKKYSIGFLGSTQDEGRRPLAEAISRYYPDALLTATAVPSSSDPHPQGRFSRDQYYHKLQQCRFVLTLPGAGYDTFRFWENAACNAVHISQRMPLFIPNDFLDGAEICRFESVDQLRAVVDPLLENQDARDDIIYRGRYRLVEHHLTHHRAAYLIDRVKSIYD